MNTQPLFNYLHQEFGVSALESDMQEIINIVNLMTIQEQLNYLSERLNQIEEQLATNHNSVADAINVQYELPNFVPDWKDAPEDAVCVAMDKDGYWFWWDNNPTRNNRVWFTVDDKSRWAIGITTNASRLHPDYWKNSLQERPKPTEPDYTHLLPEGYEFCTEEQAEKWVKVKILGITEESDLGNVCTTNKYMIKGREKLYRPIRKIKYHVAVHEVVTIEPDPYQPDWSKAPEGTVAHAYDESKLGYWYKIIFNNSDTIFKQIFEPSNLRLPSGLDWKKSLRLNPKLK
jgi:hypothetical protein